MREFFEGLYKKDNFVKRLIIVILAVIVMGLSLSFLVLVDMGTDPYTLMNRAIAIKLNMSLGNWEAIFNLLLFIIVIIAGREFIGFGTIANMFLVGYSFDFFSWIWNKTSIAGYFNNPTVRYIVFVPALIVFITVAAVYMDVELGTSPYDALPLIINKYLDKIPFVIVRIVYDFMAILIGCMFGGQLRIATVLMAFFLGPVISYIGKIMKPLLEKK